MAQPHVGIDVSKRQLDVAIRGRPEEDDCLVHDAQGIEALCQRLTSLAPDRIVVEATGGLELDLATSLQAAGLPVAVVNPRQARDFGRASSRLAKTDRIDARLWAEMAALKHIQQALCTVSPTKHEREYQETQLWSAS